MSYTPKHGGGQSKPVRQTDNSGRSRQTEPANPNNKKKGKTLVIILLVIFAAAIIVALIFLLKPVIAPEEAPVATEAEYEYTQAATTIAPSETVAPSSNPVLEYSGGEVPTSGERHDVTVADNGGVDAMEINGKWRMDKATVYMFDGYGRGVMLTDYNNYTFAYSAQNGHVIIDYDNDNGMDTDYSYILSGDTLTFIRGNSEYKFTKEP